MDANLVDWGRVRKIAASRAYKSTAWRSELVTSRKERDHLKSYRENLTRIGEDRVRLWIWKYTYRSEQALYYLIWKLCRSAVANELREELRNVESERVYPEGDPDRDSEETAWSMSPSLVEQCEKLLMATPTRLTPTERRLAEVYVANGSEITDAEACALAGIKSPASVRVHRHNLHVKAILAEP